MLSVPAWYREHLVSEGYLILVQKLYCYPVLRVTVYYTQIWQNKLLLAHIAGFVAQFEKPEKVDFLVHHIYAVFLLFVSISAYRFYSSFLLHF